VSYTSGIGPTPTATPSITPSPTPSPTICWNTFTISSSSITSSLPNGVYEELTTYSGGSLDAGWAIFSTDQFISGTATDGNDYRVFGHYDGTFYYTYVWSETAGNEYYRVVKTTGNYFPLGGIVQSNLALPTSTGSTTPDGVYYYPIAQTYTGFAGYTLTRGSICPTPTPTQTNTPSVTSTPTVTPTPSGVAFDSDAATYLADVLSAGGTLDATISGATNTLFTDLKSNGLYNKLDYFYPMLGSTSGSTGLMAKRVSGTTYDWTIGGTSTNPLSYGYSGVTGPGASPNEYAGLNFNSNQYGDSDNASVILYSNGITSSQFGYEASTLNSDADIFILRYTNGLLYKSVGTGFKTATNTDASGCYVSTITGDTTLKVFRNGVEILNTPTVRTPSNEQMILFARGNAEPSTRRLAFAGFGQGLSDSEAQTLTTIINTFQTTLGRNTY
jgi:hypothetical protein